MSFTTAPLKRKAIPVATLSAISNPSEGGTVISPPGLRSEMSGTSRGDIKLLSRIHTS